MEMGAREREREREIIYGPMTTAYQDQGFCLIYSVS